MSENITKATFDSPEITAEMVERGALALHWGHDVEPFCSATQPKSEFYYGDIKPDCCNMPGLRRQARAVLEAVFNV